MSNAAKKKKKEETKRKKKKKHVKNCFLSRFLNANATATKTSFFFHFDFVQLSSISCLRKKFHFMIEFLFSFINNKKRGRGKEKIFSWFKMRLNIKKCFAYLENLGIFPHYKNFNRKRKFLFEMIH